MRRAEHRVDWDAVGRGGEVVRPVGWRLLASILALTTVAVALVAFGALLLSDGLMPVDGPWLLAAGGLLTLVLAVTFRTAGRLLRRAPVVGFDDRGLYLPGVGLVEWTEIAELRLEQLGRGRGAKHLLGIYLADPAQVLARATPQRRVEARLESGMGRAPLSISPYGLPLELWELARRLKRRRETALRRGRAGRPHSNGGRAPNSRS